MTPPDVDRGLSLPRVSFGDRVENAWASEDNPTRVGYFVRAFTRSGKMNPGLTWEITDGKGKFWEFKPKDIGERLTVTRSPALEAPRPSDDGGVREVERDVADVAAREEGRRPLVATPGAVEAFDALDVADRLLDRALGMDVPQEWHDAIHRVQDARAALTQTPVGE